MQSAKNNNLRPLISIIIPCYNASKFLKATFKSIFFQDIKEIEIIIVDDGSTDNTKELIEGISEKIKYYYHNNKGVSYSRNMGLSVAKGKYVIFFDADDLMTSCFLKERLKILENNPEIHFACGKLQYIDSQENEIPGQIDGYSNNVLRDILFYNKKVSTCPSNYLIRREFIEKHKVRFNQNLSSMADKLFISQLGYHGKGAQTNEENSKLLYRLHSNNMSGKKNYSKLVYETIDFIKEVKRANYFDIGSKESLFFLKLNYLLLFKSFLKIKKPVKSIFYLKQYFFAKTQL